MRAFTIQIVLAIAASSIVFFGSYAQGNKAARADFKGTWVLDRARSNVSTKKTAGSPEQLKITYQDPELRVQRTIEVNGKKEQTDLVYYTDGRGETNPTTEWLTTNPGSKADKPAETTSQTRWNGNKIVTRSISRPVRASLSIEFQIAVEWKLSEDGKSLTKTTHTETRPEPMSSAVFVPGSGHDLKAGDNLVSR